MSKAAKIGFIGGFPIPDIVGPANAMLLGAQSVNPAATCNAVFLNSWYDPGKEKEAANDAALARLRRDLRHDRYRAPACRSRARSGAWSIGYASDMSEVRRRQFTSPPSCSTGPATICRAAKTVADGTWKSEVRWDGLAAGVVKLAPFNKAIPADVQAKLKQLEADIGVGQGPSLCRRAQGPGRQRQGAAGLGACRRATSAA